MKFFRQPKNLNHKHQVLVPQCYKTGSSGEDRMQDPRKVLTANTMAS